MLRARISFCGKIFYAANVPYRSGVQTVVLAGWSEEAVYDAITVCALFNFYNKWIDATGVGDMPAEAYVASGQRLAAFGYLPQRADTDK